MIFQAKQLLFKLSALITLLFLVQCKSTTNKTKPIAYINDFSDSNIIAIHQAKDLRKAELISPYLSNSHPKVRYHAALALASVQDSNSVELLHHRFITETDCKVQATIAFALLQTAKKSNTSNYKKLLEKSTCDSAFIQICRSFGAHLDFDSAAFIVRYPVKNSRQKEAQMQCYYQYSLRGKYTTNMVEQAINYLSDKDEALRFWAACFINRLNRTDIDNLDEYTENIIQSINKEKIKRVDLQLIAATKLVNSNKLDSLLLNKLATTNDVNITIQIIQSLNSTSYELAKETIALKVQDSNPIIAQVAAEYLSNYGNYSDYPLYHSLSQKIQTHWQAKVPIAHCLLKYAPSDSFDFQLNKIDSIITKSTNPYEKAAYYYMLSHFNKASKILINAYAKTDHPIEKSASLEALAQMFIKNNKHKELHNFIAQELIKQLKSTDEQLAYLAAHYLLEDAFKAESKLIESQLIHSEKQKWILPQYYETRLEFEKLQLYVEGKPHQNVSLANPQNHPINWEYVKQIPSKKQLTLVTNKGNIVLQLNVNTAPGTVAYFLQLAEEGFYNGRFFHRVVPNFVVQGGDPKGIGIGATDYSIRSEFQLENFDKAAVGIASAGKDTESCQFFITHVATPHLDGRYTLFAKVIQGMDIVNQIEIGDFVDKVEW